MLPDGHVMQETDSNKSAPRWRIEEDWMLLQAVQTFLSPSGTINWALVANVVNLSTSFTGVAVAGLRTRGGEGRRP